MPLADQLDDLGRVVTSDGPVEPADPDRFVTAAGEHRVISACVQALDQDRLVLSDEEALPLRDAHAVGALSTALARRDLSAAAAAIERVTSAPAIVLKGPAISDRFYPDP